MAGGSARTERTVPRAWAGYAACGWALGYGTLRTRWAVAGPAGRPGSAGPGGRAGDLAVAGACAIGAASAFATVRQDVPGPLPHGLRPAVGWGTCALLLAVAPGTLVLDLAGVVTLHLDEVEWADFLHRVYLVAGGVVWGLSTLLHQRRARGACPRCGRSPAPGRRAAEGRAAEGRAAEDGAADDRAADDRAAENRAAEDRAADDRAAEGRKWFGYAAAALPVLGFALPHWLWALGVPLGISAESAAELSTPGTAVAVAVLGAMAAGAGGLTLALVRPWGERFPRWVPRLAGRQVPGWLVMGPPLAASAALTPYGLWGLLAAVGCALGLIRPAPGKLQGIENWGYRLTYATFFAWGATLGAAALAYRYRTRGACRHCGRSGRRQLPASFGANAPVPAP